MPLGVNILNVLTLRIPGSGGSVPPSSLIFMTNNIKVYALLLSGNLPASSSEQAAGYIMSLKL